MNQGVFRVGRKIVFSVWAPFKKRVDLHLVSPEEKMVPMSQDGKGFWRVEVVPPPGILQYFYRLDEARDRPDPV